MSQLPGYESAGPGVPSEGGYSALEVNHTPSDSTAPEVYNAYDGLEVVNGDVIDASNKIKVDTEAAVEEPLPQRSLQKKKLWLIVGAVVLALVVVAAVVGGVVGSRHHNSTTTASSSSDPSSTSSSSASSSTPSPTPAPNSPNAAYSSSSLAVTGWWTTPSSYSIRLFYQGKDGNLRLIGYDSTDAMWSTVTTLTGPSLRLGSPIATCNYNYTVFYSSAVTSSTVSFPLSLKRFWAALSLSNTQVQPHRITHKSMSFLWMKRAKYRSGRSKRRQGQQLKI